MDIEIDLRDVRAFLAVMDEGSFTSAARRLRINQSVVSTRVAHLESILGTRLIDRGARRSVPTPAGTAALPRARALIAQSQDLVRDARRLGGGLEGTLEAAASTVPGTYYVPVVLAELRRQAPKLNVDLRLSDSSRALEALRTRSVEVAIVGQDVHADDLVAETLWTDAIILVATRDLAAAVKSAASIAAVPLVMRKAGSATRKAVVDSLGRNGIHEAQLDIVLTAPDNEVARQSALAGLAAAFVPERAVERELRSGHLARLDRIFPPARRPLELVTLRNRTLSPGARLFIEVARTSSP